MKCSANRAIACEYLKRNGLRIAEKDDIKKCADVFSKAILSDKSTKFLLGKKISLCAVADYYRIILNVYRKKGIVAFWGTEPKGVLVLLPPDAERPNAFDYINGGVLSLPFAMGNGILKRSMEYEVNCRKIKERVSHGNSWYILSFGVDPYYQGCGIGSRLMKTFLQYVDILGQDCYLETHKQCNTEIYSHYGFSVVSSDFLPDKSGEQYAMLRKCTQ